MGNNDEARVLIAGGGVAALEAALALRSFASERICVELIAPEAHFRYRAMAVAEPFALGEVRHFELAQLATAAGATFMPGRLSSIDSARHLAYTKPSGAIPYSMLLIACGAEPVSAIDGALTFHGPADTERITDVLAGLEAGHVRRVAFVVPAGAAWALPAYELALMTASWLVARSVVDAEIALVTPEDEPLQLFGNEASAAVRALLEEREVAVHTGVYPAEARDGELLLLNGDIIPADRVVALPRLRGRRIGGVPQTFDGFVPVDLHGRVTGMQDVYAAGDITTFGVKQGGIAAQQADAAAEAIAAEAGLALEPRPFEPVLRGVLLTGEGPRYLHGDRPTGFSQVSAHPLWWPPAKIVGRYLAPFLAEQSGLAPATEAVPEPSVRVDEYLNPNAVVDRRERLIAAAVGDALRERTTSRVDAAMSSKPLVVAPEDTLGEIAARLKDLDVSSALVTEYGRLIGIVTSRDMLRALAGRVHPSEARARQWMTSDPITVTVDTTLEIAKLLMTEHHVHHLPVVDGERPVGVIALADLVRSAAAPMEIGLGL